jgi:hypothetical protein
VGRNKNKSEELEEEITRNKTHISLFIYLFVLCTDVCVQVPRTTHTHTYYIHTYRYLCTKKYFFMYVCTYDGIVMIYSKLGVPRVCTPPYLNGYY